MLSGVWYLPHHPIPDTTREPLNSPTGTDCSTCVSGSILFSLQGICQLLDCPQSTALVTNLLCSETINSNLLLTRLSTYSPTQHQHHPYCPSSNTHPMLSGTESNPAMCPEACLDSLVEKPQFLKHMKNQGFPIQLENIQRTYGTLISDERLNQHFDFFTWVSKHLANLKPHNITSPTNDFFLTITFNILVLFFSANI